MEIYDLANETYEYPFMTFEHDKEIIPATEKFYKQIGGRIQILVQQLLEKK